MEVISIPGKCFLKSTNHGLAVRSTKWFGDTHQLLGRDRIAIDVDPHIV